MNTKYKQTKKVLWVILFLNLIVAIFKIVIGTIIKSASMTADGFHSLSDGSSNIVGLVGIHFASKPVDENHPYGHQKFETLASLFISFLLFFMGLNLIIDGIKKIFNPITPEITLQSIIILGATLLINLFVFMYEYREGQKLNSGILINDAKHTRSDIFVTIGVLITIISIKMGIPPIIDTIVSLIVAGFIIYAAFEIFMSTQKILVDEVGIDTTKILDICSDFSKIKDIHKIRSRRHENTLYLDLHIMTDPEMTVKESHDLVHSVENKLNDELQQNIEVISHVEPYEVKKEANI